MSQVSSSSSFLSGSGTAPKTSYNKHFPRSFLLNYGGALQDLNDEAVLKRLHDFNCEWLQRPNIAMSEMAQTLRENFPLLLQHTQGALDGNFVKSILRHFRPLAGALSRLDNKDKSNNDPATREDVVTVLKTITSEAELEDCIREGLNAAGSLFMVCVHLLVPLTLMRNAEEYAEKACRTPANQAFKEEPSVRRMCSFVLDSITKRCRPVPGASIWDCVDEEDDDSSNAHSSSRGRPRGRPTAGASRRLPSSWEDEGDSGGDDSLQPSQPSRSARHRFTGDWLAQPDHSSPSPQPLRGSKRPVTRPLSSTPVKGSNKRPRAAAVAICSSPETSASEDEGQVLALAKRGNAPAASAPAGKSAQKSHGHSEKDLSCPAKRSKTGGQAKEKASPARRSSSLSSSSSSSSVSFSEESGDDRQPSRKPAAKGDKRAADKKSCQDSSKATLKPPGPKAYGKSQAKVKQVSKKTQKVAASPEQEDDDVWAQLGAAHKKKVAPPS